jgi:hypothetical protein
MEIVVETPSGGPASAQAAGENAFDARLAEFAQIERALVAEFPDAPNGYEGLLNIARDSSPKQGAAIVAELLSMETTPSEIKTQAVVMRARYALAGRPVSELAPGLPLAPGKETWLYTWSKSSPESIALARMLADTKPDTVELLGLCLDREAEPPLDGSAGEESASIQPGRLIQDDGTLSAALVLTGPGLVYAIGEGGRIRTVNILNELHAARRSANNEGREQ